MTTSLIPQYTPSGYNAWLFYEIMDQVTRNPETWDQQSWGEMRGCHTSHCIAGWAAVMTGHKLKWEQVGSTASIIITEYTTTGDAIEHVAQYALGLDDEQADAIFGSMTKDLDQMWDIIAETTDHEVTYVDYQAWLGVRDGQLAMA